MFSSTSQSEERLRDWSSLLIIQILQKLLRTSVVSALARRVWVHKVGLFTSRDPSSTESFLASWLKVAISLEAMAAVANPSMVANSKMKIFPKSMTEEVFSPWPTLDQTPTALSSSYASFQLLISMESTSFSDVSLRMRKTVSVHSSLLVQLLPVEHLRTALLSIAERFNECSCKTSLVRM